MQVLDLKIGDTVTITGFQPGANQYRKRLLAMGLTPGTPFRVLRIAPFGDPIAILVRGVMLSLRKVEANILKINLAIDNTTITN
ncbi:MAG TPA: FeoA family protein [Myxococcota bacterium]|nr:FeoA family protein [Myxococcota bacterium]